MSFCDRTPVPMKVIAHLLGQDPEINSPEMQNVRDCVLLQTSNVKMDEESVEVVSLHETTQQFLSNKLLITGSTKKTLAVYVTVCFSLVACKLILQPPKNLIERLLPSQLHMIYPLSSRMLQQHLLLNTPIFSRIWLVMSSIMRTCSHIWNLSE